MVVFCSRNSVLFRDIHILNEPNLNSRLKLPYRVIQCLYGSFERQDRVHAKLDKPLFNANSDLLSVSWEMKLSCVKLLFNHPLEQFYSRQ